MTYLVSKKIRRLLHAVPPLKDKTITLHKGMRSISMKEYRVLVISVDQLLQKYNHSIGMAFRNLLLSSKIKVLLCVNDPLPFALVVKLISKLVKVSISKITEKLNYNFYRWAIANAPQCVNLALFDRSIYEGKKI